VTEPIERPAIYPALAALAGDLAQPTGGSSPPGLGIGTATVLDWDASTLNGTFDYRGTTLSGLPVLSALDAFSWVAGDEVLLLTWHPTDGHRRKGLGSYFVIGRVFRPSAANSAKALQALQNEFAEQISAEIFAQRMHFQDINTTEAIASSSYTDLATTGPTVFDVDVTEAGKMLVFTSVRINLNNVSFSGGQTADGYASFQISGATSISANDSNAAFRRMNFAAHDGGVAHTINDGGTYTKMTLVEGLNAGNHTVQMKYRRSIGNDVTIGMRSLVVIAF
jgi:hypothetical protein